MRRLLSPQGRAPVWMLALRDLIHDWRLTLVAVMTVTVALAPTILLFGLKLGVVDAMRDRLARNPANLEIRLLAGAENGLEPEFFARIAALPQTGFLAPMTRENGPPLVLLNQAAMDSDAVEVSLYPSAEGDPLLAAAGVAPPTGEGIVLSEPVAKALQVQPGEKLISILRRIDGANSETVNPELTVTGVLPRTLTERSAIWVAQDFLIAVEDYRDWREVARYGWTGAQSVKDLFVSFRLYARSMDDVAPLVDHLEAEEHLSVRSAANAIAHVKRIDADLTLLFAVFLTLSAIGYAAAVALNQIATVTRKRESLAVLRLLGASGAELTLFPLVQAAAIALVGAAAALFVFVAADPVIGALFAELVEARGSLLRLPFLYVAAILGGSLAAAVLAGLFAARRAAAINPATELRNV